MTCALLCSTALHSQGLSQFCEKRRRHQVENMEPFSPYPTYSLVQNCRGSGVELLWEGGLFISGKLDKLYILSSTSLGDLK